jgi:hypothetical protein
MLQASIHTLERAQQRARAPQLTPEPLLGLVQEAWVWVLLGRGWFSPGRSIEMRPLPPRIGLGKERQEAECQEALHSLDIREQARPAYSTGDHSRTQRAPMPE